MALEDRRIAVDAEALLEHRPGKPHVLDAEHHRLAESAAADQRVAVDAEVAQALARAGAKPDIGHRGQPLHVAEDRQLLRLRDPRLRVVELGVWVAAPAAAALLADWGADVIKVEAPTGDPMRNVFGSLGIDDDMPNPAFALDNRGKRSVCLDLRADEDRERMEALLASADALLPEERMLVTIHLREVEQRLILDTAAEQLRRDSANALQQRNLESAAELRAALEENRRLRAELDDATQKLSALAAIEQSIREREQ